MAAAHGEEASRFGVKGVAHSDGLGLGEWVLVHSYTTESIQAVKMNDGAVIRYRLTPINQWFCEHVGWLEEVEGLFKLTCMRMRVAFGDWAEKYGKGDTGETGMVEWCALAARSGGEVDEPVKVKDDKDFARVKRLVEGTTQCLQKREGNQRGLIDEMVGKDLVIEWGRVQGVERVRVNLFGITEQVRYGDGDGWLASVGTGPGPSGTG